MTDYLLALDAGTGSCRAIVFTADGHQVASAAREWSHREVPGVPVSQDFDTSTNWQLICECIREVLAGGIEPADIRGVAATSMREGIVLYDGAGTEVWACPNADARAGAQAAELVANGSAARIYEVAGDWVSITTPARLIWLRRNQPELFASVRHLGMLSDWVVYRLTGEFITDPTSGSSTAMFDLAARDWSPEIVALTGLPSEVLPPVVPAATVVGKIGAESAAETGLLVGTPVVTAGADTQMGLVGMGAQRGGLSILGGSFWQQAVVVDTPLIDPHTRLRTLCHVGTDSWMIEGIGFYSGLALRWFRDAFCDDIMRAARDEGRSAYELIEAHAATVPAGASGVIAVIGNVMQASAWSHPSPSFVQLDLGRPETGRWACARAIMENAAFVSRAHSELLAEVTGHHFATVDLAAGASAGSLWPQIIADVLGKPVRAAATTEATARGTASCAALGVGLTDQFPQAEHRAVFTPDAGRHQQYDGLYRQWRDVTGAMTELADHGLVQPLWRAPGVVPSLPQHRTQGEVLARH